MNARGSGQGDVQNQVVRNAEGPLKMLTPQQIRQIDEALAKLGPFGEVRLIKQRGRLRFIQKIESESAVQPPV